MPEQAVYTHGHHASVIKSHARRTAENSVSFLIPHIKPHYRILDIGCGQGSITIDLAKLVPQGSVIGIDSAEEILTQARDLAQERGSSANLTFLHHDANELPFSDGEFDIVYCHQVLHHVAEPVTILREMARVSRGIVAAREADYAAFAWYPELPGITTWLDAQLRVFRANGGHPNAGRYLGAWAREAGFEKDDVTLSWDCWHYQEEEAVAWAESWADRALYSSFATTATKEGIATQEDLESIAAAWREWGVVEGAFIVVPNGQIVCRVR